MNLREGTRRLALLLGAAGAIAGGFASYMELQPVMRQRADHQRFEQLANSDVVQQARKDLGIAALAAQYGGKALDAPKPVFTIGPPPPPPPSTLPGDFNGWDIEPSVVNKGGISTIGWNKGYLVAYIQTQDGQTLYPTPAPGVWSYLLIAILPVLGFFIPWGAVRAIGWVGAGFFQPSKAD